MHVAHALAFQCAGLAGWLAPGLCVCVWRRGGRPALGLGWARRTFCVLGAMRARAHALTVKLSVKLADSPTKCWCVAMLSVADACRSNSSSSSSGSTVEVAVVVLVW